MRPGGLDDEMASAHRASQTARRGPARGAKPGRDTRRETRELEARQVHSGGPGPTGGVAKFRVRARCAAGRRRRASRHAGPTVGVWVGARAAPGAARTSTLTWVACSRACRCAQEENAGGQGCRHNQVQKRARAVRGRPAASAADTRRHSEIKNTRTEPLRRGPADATRAGDGELRTRRRFCCWLRDPRACAGEKHARTPRGGSSVLGHWVV